MRVPSTLMTPMLSSVAYATALPSPVQRVANGREVFAGTVASERAADPSRLDAQSTNSPDGLCRQYASRPFGESGTAAPAPAANPGEPAPASTVARTSAIDPAGMSVGVATQGRSAPTCRMPSIIA